MNNLNKILWALVFFALIGMNVSAQQTPPMKLTGNECAEVENIVNNCINNYTNNSGINFTNYPAYTLKVAPGAVPAAGKRIVNVFLFPGNETKWLIKFTVDLNAGEVIKTFRNPDALNASFGKSKQDKGKIKEALRIANNNPEIKKQFAQLNFTKIPHTVHIKADNKNEWEIVFMPVNAYEKVKTGLVKRQNIMAIHVDLSLEEKKIIRAEIKEFIAEKREERKERMKAMRNESKSNGKGESAFVKDKSKGDENGWGR